MLDATETCDSPAHTVIHLACEQDSRECFLSATRTLANLPGDPTNVSIEDIATGTKSAIFVHFTSDYVVGGYLFTEPQMALVFDYHRILPNFFPWHIRLTEFLYSFNLLFADNTQLGTRLMLF